MEIDLENAVGVQCKNSCSYVETLFECLDKGRIVVPVMNKDDGRMAATGVDSFIAPVGSGGWMSIKHTPSQSRKIAQISFTSGTEGNPKGVLLSHRNLSVVVENLVEVMSITDDIREYIGIPVYHSFGYGRCRAVAAVGGEFFIPKDGFNPIELAKMIKEGKINAISSVPSLWRTLLSNPDLIGSSGDCIKWIEIGSQFMPKDEKLQIRAMFPNAIIVQHYGLTEASRSTFLKIHDEPLDHLDSVGRPLVENSIDVNGENRILIHGENVALGVLIEGEVHPVTNRDGWMVTSDFGRVENGLLYYEGRADDIINFSGVKLSPDALELRVRLNSGIDGGYAISRIPDLERGDGILISKCSGDDTLTEQELLTEIKKAISEAGAQIGNRLKIQYVLEIPLTGPGKIQRKKLSQLFLTNTADVISITDDNQSTIFFEEVAKILNVELISDRDSFISLGGDSLSHISIAILLQKHMKAVPDDWERVSFGVLKKSISEKIKYGEYSCAQNERAPQRSDGSIDTNPSDITFFELIKEDFRSHGSDISSQGFWAVFVCRFGNWRMSVKTKALRAPLTVIYHLLSKWIQISCGIKLDYTVVLGRRVTIEHFGGIILGARKIGDDVILRQNTTLGIRSTKDLNAKPIIENNVDIGAGVVIVGNVTIGEGSRIGANTVIFTDIPPNSLVMCSPAKILPIQMR